MISNMEKWNSELANVLMLRNGTKIVAKHNQVFSKQGNIWYLWQEDGQILRLISKIPDIYVNVKYF